MSPNIKAEGAVRGYNRAFSQSLSMSRSLVSLMGAWLLATVTFVDSELLFVSLLF